MHPWSRAKSFLLSGKLRLAPPLPYLSRVGGQLQPLSLGFLGQAVVRVQLTQGLVFV